MIHAHTSTDNHETQFALVDVASAVVATFVLLFERSIAITITGKFVLNINIFPQRAIFQQLPST